MEILPLLKRLQRGIVACMACQNTKVIRAVHSFLAKLMSLFPIESGKYKSNVCRNELQKQKEVKISQIAFYTSYRSHQFCY